MKKTTHIFVGNYAYMNDTVSENRRWIAIRNIKLSRRKLLDDIANTIYNYEGVILMEGGHFWPIPDIYDVFGGIEGRWLSYYCEEVDGRPRRKPRPETLERRRIIDLYFRIKFPKTAATFKR